MASAADVTQATTGATIPVAVDVAGSSSLAYQIVKLAGGGIGDTTPIIATTGVPALNAAGLVVQNVPGQSVSAQVSGTVSVSGAVGVSGTVTVFPGVSVVAQVSGTVSLSTLPAISGTVSLCGSALVSGTVSVSGYTSNISGTVSVSGTVVASMVPGVSVNIGSQATGVYTTTGTSGVTGPIVWLGASQSLAAVGTVLGTVNVAVAGTAVVTVVPGLSVSAQVSGTVSVSNFTTVVSGAVSISGTALVSVVPGVSVTVVTQLGTQVVSVVPGLSVTADVSGTVTVSGYIMTTAQASGVTGPIVWLAASQTGIVAESNPTTAIATTTQALVTGAVVGLGPSQTIIVSGVSVSVSAAFSTTALATTTQAAVTGAVVWMAPTQTMNVTVLSTAVVTLATGATVATLLGTVNVTLAGTGVVSVVPGVSVNLGSLATVVGTTTGTSGATAILAWLAVGQTLASIQTVGTVLGTVAVNVVAGGAGGGSVTTAGPSVSATGQVMGIAGGQSAIGNPVYVSVSGTAVVSLATGGTLATLLGTINATAVGTAVVTLATGGTIATLLGTVPVTGTIQNIASISTILGTQIVSIVPGVSVSLGSLATIVGTTTATSGVTGIVAWLGVGQTLATIQTVGTVLGTVAVNVVAGSVTVAGTAIVTLATGATLATLLGTVNVTLAGTGLVSVVPGLSVSAVVSGTVTVGGFSVVTTQSNITGQPIWLAPTQTMALVSTVATVLGTVGVTIATGASVTALDVGRTQVMLIMTSSSVGISGTMMLFTAYQGQTQNVAGTTGYVVPANKTFRVLSAAMVVQNSVTTSPVFHQLFICQSTAAPTWTSTVPIVMAVGAGAYTAGVYFSACGVGIQDIPAGATVGLGYTIGTSGGTVNQIVVNGYLFP